ncbi:MAG: GntR family transcriptional regulator [Bacilli bacterium]
MFISIDFADDKPIYLQIHDQVIDAIAGGKMFPGSALPSSRQLAAEFGINFHTVNKAYNLLREERYIQFSRKKTAVVSEPSTNETLLQEWDNRERTLLAELVARGVSRQDIAHRIGCLLDSVRLSAENGSKEGGQK